MYLGPAIERCYNAEDLRAESKKRLPKWIFEFVDGGAEDGLAIVNNVEAFRRLKLRGRVLVDMSGRDLGATIFGGPSTLPLAIAPTGAAGLCWYEGELALAKAAARFGVPFTMAIGSTTPLEKVAAEAGGRLWFQLYIWENQQQTADLVRRVRGAGYEALVLTVDVGLGTNREHNYRNGWGNPFKPSYRTVRDILLRPRWLFGTLLRYLTTTGMPRHANNPPEAKKIAGAHLRSKEGAVSWEDFKRLRDLWPGTIMVKGILRADDAEKAVEYGANGIVVSNHGGRVLDSAVATIDALPAIAKAVGERATVMIDSGIRRGSDIVKARALGAKAVLLGRPALWGTTVAGEAGAMHALKLIRREYELTMSHVGCRSADEIGPDVLALDGAPAAAIQ